MNKDYNTLKKYYGENFAQLCRGLFPTLLEQEGLLSNIILSKFSPNHYLYDDIVSQESEEDFKNYIYCFINVEKDNIEINKSVKELLSDAGYNFYECKSEEDIQSFKKYYAKGEELCTFNGGRLNRCLVFWAVKKNVDRIKREDFENPTREDEYGTSVMSIQFTKEGHTLSIKNRYNHHVNNPDATYSNNLDNIIPGLTNAFERECGFRINQNNYSRFKLPNYVLADDGKWYKFNYEINNIYYCPDNIIIDNGQVKQYDKSRYLIIDYFIIDMKKKKLELFDKTLKDCFPDSFINIEKIQTIKTPKGKNIVIKAPEKENVIITINKLNKIVSIDDKNIKVINDYYLYHSNLKELNLPKLEKVGNNFLYFNRSLNKINLPNLKKAGGEFLPYNLKLTNLNLPKLQVVGNYFIWKNKIIEEINFPNLEKVGDKFMFDNLYLTKLNLPNLKEGGNLFLEMNMNIEELNLPNLEKVGGEFLPCNHKLTKLNLPKLKKAGNYFLYQNEIISELNLPNLEEVEDCFMSKNKLLTKLDLPNLRVISSYNYESSFLYQNEIISELNLPNLEEVGGSFLARNNSLTRLSLPKLKKAGDYFLNNNEIISEINMPNIESIGSCFMPNNLNLTKLDLPNLKEVDGLFLEKNKAISKVNLPNLEKVEDNFMPDNNSIKKIDLPKLKKIYFGFLENNTILEEINFPNLNNDNRSCINNKRIISILEKKYQRKLKKVTEKAK
ncbi:MAG: hypothetical protein VZS44_02905 [Bacilli bacterium]|nr:hypothetical protein [Bacilli bacterium]